MFDLEHERNRCKQILCSSHHVPPFLRRKSNVLIAESSHPVLYLRCRGCRF